MNPKLGLFDEGARIALAQGETVLRDAGASVQVGDSHDEAYEEPNEIRSVYEHTRALDAQLSKLASPRLRPARLPRVPQSRAVADDALKEAFRRQWLYRADQTDSLPWHQQRGRATALLTITSAHDLSDETGQRKYPTMSGPLTDRVFQHTFPKEVGVVGGLDLISAVAAVAEFLLWA